MSVVPLPVVFVAVTVKVVDVKSADGEPEITPVEELMLNPDGSDGEMDHEAAVPALFVGANWRIATPVASCAEDG